MSHPLLLDADGGARGWTAAEGRNRAEPAELGLETGAVCKFRNPCALCGHPLRVNREAENDKQSLDARLPDHRCQHEPYTLGLVQDGAPDVFGEPQQPRKISIVMLWPATKGYVGPGGLARCCPSARAT